MSIRLMKSSEFAKRIGISVRTLDRKIEAGEIKPSLVKNRFRYFSEEDIEIYSGKEIEKKERISIAYIRVSSSNQKNELKNQETYIENYAIKNSLKIDKYLSDIGSGINFNRKNFLKLLEAIMNNEVSVIYITYKDRLCRFAFDLIEYICKLHNTKIEIINLKSTSPQEELIEDLMTIIHVFSNRLYGLKRYKKEIQDVLNSKDKD
ncbi:MAG: hypothetical protein [Bacteriophage sp.]|nr:MAG: hypothetical protein [Bacteriophage sp.]